MLSEPYRTVDENKHHRVRDGTLDEVIMKKWNLNFQYSTSKKGCFPISTVRNLDPQSKIHQITFVRCNHQKQNRLFIMTELNRLKKEICVCA